MGGTEYAYSWETKGLERRLDALEERLTRRDQQRLQNAFVLFWTGWGAGIGALVTAAALS